MGPFLNIDCIVETEYEDEGIDVKDWELISDKDLDYGGFETHCRRECKSGEDLDDDDGANSIKIDDILIKFGSLEKREDPLARRQPRPLERNRHTANPGRDSSRSSRGASAAHNKALVLAT